MSRLCYREKGLLIRDLTSFKKLKRAASTLSNDTALLFLFTSHKLQVSSVLILVSTFSLYRQIIVFLIRQSPSARRFPPFSQLSATHTGLLPE